MNKRTVAADTLAESQRTTTQPVYLIEIAFETVMRICTGKTVTFGVDTYEGGLGRVTGYRFGSDGSFEGTLLLFDDENYTIAKLIETEKADNRSFTLWRAHIEPNGALTTPVEVARGIIDRPSEEAAGIRLSLVGKSYRTTIVPPLRATRANGFNHLPRHGEVLVWQGEKHVIEVKS